MIVLGLQLNGKQFKRIQNLKLEKPHSPEPARLKIQIKMKIVIIGQSLQLMTIQPSAKLILIVSVQTLIKYCQRDPNLYYQKI